ncbi:MAG: glycoside hydrolase family 3 C-terminal domain-containing protein [Nocardioidaceae bacterium]|nr:glycoside hydrolase family 3 C-terminal domain-containing protein [Nocardioidaceae bacterium]
MRHTSKARPTRWWALICAVLVGLSLAPAAVAGNPSASTGGTASVEGDRGTGWVRNTLGRMTLEEKVGQLFMTYAYGETADTQAAADVARNQSTYGVDNAAELIDKYKLGGVIYFAWSNNVNNPEQIAGLSNGVHDASLSQRVATPSLIATDQEGGIVARVGPPATQFPGNMALGATRSTNDAQTAASITGQELKALGVNWNFAPVADVNVNPQNPVIGVRSYSSDPALAADMTAAQVLGYQGAGIAAAAKHFPGHGDTSVDSHTGIPIIDHTREEWEQIDKPPFQAAIDQGIKAIMTAHIVVPSLDPSGDPATLSRPILTGILRNEMGYNGVVITDSLGMAGVRDKYGDGRVPVLALKAGADMLLMPPNLELAYNAVLDAVRSGELTEKRINTSVRRILRLKWDLGLVGDPYVDVSDIPKVVGTPEHLKAAQELTDRSTTLVKNDGDLLPLAANTGQSVFVTGWGVTTTATIAGKIEERGDSADVYETGTNPSEAQIQAAVAAAETHDVTVVVSYRAWVDSSSGQRELVRRLTATGKPVIAVAARDAYDIAYFPEVPAYLATYSWTGVSLESAVRVLYGEVNPQGKLPVTIPTADDPDTVLYPFGHGLTY